MAGDRKTILIVEDNLSNRRLIEAVLQPRGYRLLIASDGFEAIEIARSQLPDLILMDLRLPRLSGFEAARQLKSLPETAHVPILALSACVLLDDRRDALESGCDGFIAKPINTRAFADDLKRYLDNNQRDRLLAE